MSTDTVIAVKNVAKDFILPHEKNTSIKSGIVGVFKKKKRTKDTQHALREVSFEVKKGDFFGIVGRNGSGKSTLLKIISQIYKPTKGTVDVKGRLIPFIELGVGFNPELTGRENVFLNGALLGFSRKEIEDRYDEIVEFAELEDFMDQKLKNYSSGMQVRLAFSVAIRADADVLILDEVLAVGDEAFQRKCNDYFYRAKREGKTIVLVTHSMESVRQFCNKAVLIDNGLVAVEGSPDKVASAYSKMFITEYADQAEKLDHEVAEKPRLSDVTAQVDVLQNNKETKAVNFREDFSLKFVFNAEKAYKNLTFAVHLIDQAGRINLELSTKQFEGFALKPGSNEVQFDIQNVYTEGEYYLNFAIKQNETNNLLIKEEEWAPFLILGLDASVYNKFSLTHPKVKATIGGVEQQAKK